MRIWSRMSMKKQLRWLAVVTTLCVAVIVLLTSGFAYRRTEESWRNLAHDMAQQSLHKLDSWAQQMVNTSYTVSFDVNVQEFMWAQSVEEYMATFSKMSSTLSIYSEFQSVMTDVVLEGLCYARQSAYIPVRPSSLPKAEGTTPEFSPLLVMDDLYDEKVTHKFICVSAQCKSTLDERKLYANLGQVYVLAEGLTLSEGMGLVTDGADLMTWVVDQNGTIIAASDPNQIGQAMDPQIMDEPVENWTGKTTYNGEDMIACRVYHPLTGYSVVTMVPRSVMADMMDNTLGSQLVNLGCMGALLLLVYLVITRGMLFPLKKATDYIRRQGRSGLIRPRERLDLSGNQEVEELAASFNAMLEKMGSLSDELIATHDRLHEAEMFKAQSEMAMLMSQINPHFLYNTLESIKGMAYRAGAPQIVETTKALGSIFRYSVKAPAMVSLKEEMRILESYFAIQRMRCGDRFSMEAEAELGILECMVPKMCLQPLCENAIYHGLELKSEPGHLLVRAVRIGKDIRIQVMDDGLGMEEETLRNVRESLGKELPREGERVHIGVANVHARLRLYYGQDYGLTVESSPGKGTCVTLRIPVRSSGDV